MFLSEKANDILYDEDDVRNTLEDTVWEKIENTVNSELGTSFFIDSVKDFLIKHNNRQVSKDELINIIAPLFGPLRHHSDVDVVLDYLEIYDLIKQDSFSTFYVDVDDVQNEGLLRMFIQSIV